MKKLIDHFQRFGFLAGSRLSSAIHKEDSARIKPESAMPPLSEDSKLTPRKIRYFNAPLVEHCNLRCRGCDHFAPLAKPVFTDLNVFQRDFARLSELVEGDIEKIGLMGGEPLLHPEAAKFFPVARKYFPKTRIRIVSNGVALLKQKEEFWKACAESNIIVEITKYPIRLKFDKMKEVCAAHGATFEFRDDTEVVQKTSYHIPLDLEGRQDARSNFEKCFHANVTISLTNGRLYTCTIVPNVRHFNAHFHQNLPATDRDSIDIHQAKSARELYEFLCHPIPFCRFCWVEKRTFGLPWARSRKDIKEWTI